MTGIMWEDEKLSKHLKPINDSLLKKFGLSRENTQFVNNLEELKQTPPNIVVADAVKTFSFIQNFFKRQTIVKKKKYVMGLGVFQQLQFDKQNSKRKLLKPAEAQFKKIYKPYRGQNLDGKSVLVQRTGGAGDLIFILPNLMYLKEKYPTCKIFFACGPQYQPMVEAWECVDKILDLPYEFQYLLKSDYQILFEGVIERCHEAKKVNAYNLFSRWLGLDLPDELLVPKQTPKFHLVEECGKILDNWGIKDKKIVLMQLRASSPIRTPRHEFWIKIINELNNRGYYVCLTDNPRQKDKIDDFIKLLDKQDMTFNFCKYSKSFDYTVALTSLCIGTFSTDSALGHIAASVDKYSFGIFGPFPGFIRYKTYPKGKWVDAKRECGPCYIHGHTPCRPAGQDGYSPCYDDLIATPEKLKEVIDKFEDLVND